MAGGSGGGETGSGLCAGLLSAPGLSGDQPPGVQPGLQVRRGGGQAAQHLVITRVRLNMG